VSTTTTPQFEEATYKKAASRLIPFLFLCYIIAFLDRVNVGFAKLQMAGDLKYSDAIYGFGAGIFFIGYFIFEVPSNVILERVGARIWIARIMITWGLISSAFMFAGDIHWGTIATYFNCTDAQFTFYFLRFWLGVAEAGFFPGVILYLTYWFPGTRRAKMVALFMTAIGTAQLVGSPVSGGDVGSCDFRSPGSMEAKTGSSSIRSKYSAIQSTSSWPKRRNSSLLMSPKGGAIVDSGMSGLLTGRYLTLILSGAALPQSASVLRLCRFPCGKPLAFRVPTNLT